MRGNFISLAIVSSFLSFFLKCTLYLLPKYCAFLSARWMLLLDIACFFTYLTLVYFLSYSCCLLLCYWFHYELILFVSVISHHHRYFTKPKSRWVFSNFIKIHKEVSFFEQILRKHSRFSAFWTQPKFPNYGILFLIMHKNQTNQNFLIMHTSI